MTLSMIHQQLTDEDHAAIASIQAFFRFREDEGLEGPLDGDLELYARHLRMSRLEIQVAGIRAHLDLARAGSTVDIEKLYDILGESAGEAVSR